MTNFEKWDKEFRTQNLYLFNNNKNALLWLKVRAVCRGKQLDKFITDNKIPLVATKIAAKNIELFERLEKNESESLVLLDNYLNQTNNEWYTSMGINENDLKTELFKVDAYTWGGDQNNSLDKHLVSKYVKVIDNYDILTSKKDEISKNSWDYVLASWYNNWTSFLIESLFKRNPKVISAVGEIKSVDFFINEYPVDLKVTYFPNQYMDEKLKTKYGKSELTWLKNEAKNHNIKVDTQLSHTLQMKILKERLSAIGLNKTIATLNVKRKEVINEAIQNKSDLMQWLYANQGEMRFGAENRLFVILVDSTDMSQSWKMKRAFDLIEPKVNSYLEQFTDQSLQKIKFSFKGNVYESLADIIFVVKE